MKVLLTFLAFVWGVILFQTSPQVYGGFLSAVLHVLGVFSMIFATKIAKYLQKL